MMTTLDASEECAPEGGLVPRNLMDLKVDLEIMRVEIDHLEKQHAQEKQQADTWLCLATFFAAALFVTLLLIALNIV